MKQKDIALFLVVGIFSAIVSVFVSNLLITPSESKKQQAEVVSPISSDFTIPSADNKYINKDSVNPTKLIQIGDGGNTTPFNGTAQ
ncbi:hypothetical protein KDA11_01045 [Candidatus Saccharibacteria bacterium]|nr:hypothetical protein [Candidatus Saccharibacteria bacterium]